MRLRRSLVLAAASATALLLLTGCQTPVVTMVNPPGWGGATAEPAPAPVGPTVDEVESAGVPSVCGLPAGTLADGVLGATPNAVPIGGQATAQADDVRIAESPATGEPIVGLAADRVGTIGAAAVFSCTTAGVESRDRVVVWSGALEPLGAINLASLRGTGPVVGLDVEILGPRAMVTFQEIGTGTIDAPAGARMLVPLTVENGQVVVGALTVG